MSQENSQAFEEKITACKIPHSLATSLPTKKFVIKNLGDEKCLQGKDPSFLALETLIHPMGIGRPGNQVDKTLHHVDEIQLQLVKHT